MSDSIFTIITRAEKRGLCTLDALKRELSVTDDARDAELTSRIVEASRIIESYCRRVFARETVQEVFSAHRGDDLSLRRYPVASISSVVIDGIALDDTAYELDAEAGMLWRRSGERRSCWYGSRLTVVYASGYVLPGASGADLPEDISRACVIIAASSELGAGRDPMLRSESAQDIGQTSWLDPRAGMEAMPPQAAGLLEPFRNFVP